MIHVNVVEIIIDVLPDNLELDNRADENKYSDTYACTRSLSGITRVSR